jgi:hypothetical protein
MMKSLLAFFHGKNPALLDYILVHGLGITFGIWALWPLLPTASPFPLLILGLLGYDMAGGVIANRLPSTDAFYSDKPFWIKALFLVGHVAQPLLLHIAFPPATLPTLLFLWGAVFLLGMGILLAERLLPPGYTPAIGLAAALAVSLVFRPFFQDMPYFWFPWLYTFKLLGSFAPSHTRN